MARAWIYDRMNEKGFAKRVTDARKAKRLPPMRWEVKWPDPDRPGKTRSELRRTVPEAEALRDKIAADLEAGTYRDPKAARTKLTEVAEEWFTARTPKWAPKTKRLYREILKGYVLPRWGTTAIGAVGYGDYAVWLAGLHKKPGLQGSKERIIGASRVQSIHHVMLGVMTWAVKSQRIAENPIRALDTLPEVAKGKRLYLDHHQITALADSVADLKTAYKNKKPKPMVDVYRVMVLTLAYCGLRIGEAIALRAGSVDLDAHELHVTEAVIEGEDGKPALGLPKGGKIRVVGIPEFLAMELKVVLSGLDEEDLVFPSPKGDMVSAYNWRERIFRPAVKEAKLPEGTTPHTLRHSFASLSVAEGADVKTLQAAMGHASATMTLDVYTDLFPARIGEVATALGKAREMALAA